MKEMLFNMAAFSGDFDGSVEAMTNLMQTGLTADWMEKATDIFSYASDKRFSHLSSFRSVPL